MGEYLYIYIRQNRVTIADNPGDDPKVRVTANYLMYLDDELVIVHVPGHAKRKPGTSKSQKLSTYRVPTYFYIMKWCAMVPVWNEAQSVLHGYVEVLSKIQSWSSEEMRRDTNREVFANYRNRLTSASR